MIVQLVSHCTMLSVPVIGIILFALFEIPYLIVFVAMIECGPTITAVLTLISVPEYRKKLKICFHKITKPSVFH